MRAWFLCLGLFLCMWLPATAHAHELRPAYLSVTQIADTEYSILWKTPALGEKQLALKANFPTSCTVSNGLRRIEENKFAIETWTLTCPQSLRGQSLTIGGLEKTLTDVLVRTIWQDGKISTARLTPDNTTLDFAHLEETSGTIRTYFVLGMAHILGGIDHLLFVLAVMLLVTRGKKLFVAVTAFTIGHSVTLALATLDIIRVQPSLVEVLIAMSIVLMAYEAARRWQGRIGLTLEYPWLVTFLFGLLHGFGFAGALRAIGLPQTDIPAALLFFNIGVEAGQLLFIMAVIAVFSLPVLSKLRDKKIPMITASYTIGIIAVFWTLQRTVPMFA